MKRRRGGSLVSQIHQSSARVFHRLLLDAGIGDIPPGQGKILFALMDGEGMPISALAKKTSLDKSTLTGMIDRLEKNGLVERHPSAQDKRVVQVRRTGRWKEVAPKFEQVSNDMTALFYAGMSDAEIDEFEVSLEKVLANCIAAETQ